MNASAGVGCRHPNAKAGIGSGQANRRPVAGASAGRHGRRPEAIRMPARPDAVPAPIAVRDVGADSGPDAADTCCAPVRFEAAKARRAASLVQVLPCQDRCYANRPTGYQKRPGLCLQAPVLPPSLGRFGRLSVATSMTVPPCTGGVPDAGNFCRFPKVLPCYAGEPWSFC